MHELREVVSGRGGSQLQENDNAPVSCEPPLIVEKRAHGATRGLFQRTRAFSTRYVH